MKNYTVRIGNTSIYYYYLIYAITKKVVIITSIKIKGD